MEVAGLVLGIVPLAVELLQAWKTVHEKAKAFARAPKFVDATLCRASTRGELFRKELEGLLVAIEISVDEADRMLADASHVRWKRAGDEIAAYLDGSGTAYMTLAQQVANQLKVLHEKLPLLKEIYSQRKMDQIKPRLHATWSKTDYESLISTLNADNCNLAELRRRCEKVTESVHKVLEQSLTGFATVPMTQKACAALGDTMLTLLTCTTADHKDHIIQLDLEVKLLRGDSVELDFAMGIGGSHVQTPHKMRHLFLETRASAAKARVRGAPNGTNDSVTSCEILAKCGCLNKKDEFLGRLPKLSDDSQTTPHLPLFRPM